MSRSDRSSKRRGVAAVFVMVLLPVIVGFAALTVDVGYLYNVKTELQNSADAGAMAAAAQLAQPDLFVGTPSGVAQQYANLNSPDHGNVVAASDVHVGFWDSATGTFTEGGLPANAVRVIARRSEANGNPVGLLFAAALGRTYTDVAAAATAAVAIAPPKTAEIVPVALPGPGFGPVDPKIAAGNPFKLGPSEPADGIRFQIGEEIVLATLGKGPQSSVGLELAINEYCASCDISNMLQGASPPFPLTIEDEIHVNVEDSARELLERLEDAYDDNDIVIVPVLGILPGSRDAAGELTGPVEIVDFVAVRVTGEKEFEMTDPTDPGKTLTTRNVVGSIVAVVSGSGFGSGTAGTFSDGSVKSTTVTLTQ